MAGISDMFTKKTSGGDLSPEVADATFLGTLRSEFDEPTHLEEPFRKILSGYNDLLEKYLEGEIDGHAFGDGMKDLIWVDGTGASWSIGASSGRWYRRGAGETRWVATPPDAVAIS